MRIAVVGASLLACLMGLALVGTLMPSVGWAQRAAVTPSTGGLITMATAAGEHRQQVTVIDPDTRVLSVYHIDLNTGAVELKSVRNIHWDLQLGEFNGISPLPRDVRSMLEQR